MIDPRIERAASVEAVIVDLLRHRWNPLAITDAGQAAGFYAPLVGPLYRLIATGAAPLRLAVELAEAERRIGRTTPVDELVPVGRALAVLDVRL